MRAASTAAALAALAVAASGGGAGAAPDAAYCDFEILPEPSHTRGRSNTIRWDSPPNDCWKPDSSDRRFVVTITNSATGARETVTVHGRDEVDARVGPEDFPAAAVDGQRFVYLVTRKEKRCLDPVQIGQTCSEYSTLSNDSANVVSSTQDDRVPTGSLVLAGGRPFVRTLDVPVGVNANDPGAAASGPGYVAFGAERRGGCPLGGCAQPIVPGMIVRLEPGPDGRRTVEARVYDRARGPADDPGATTIGTPPGNVSASFQDDVYLDRTAPAIFIRVSTMRVMVGSPVTFDASQSVDQLDGSGLQPVTGQWSFGEGPGVTGRLVATHTYTRTGRFPFSFSVADNVGNIARVADVEVEVLATPVPPQPGTTQKPPQAPPPTSVDRRAPALSALSAQRRNGRTTIGLRVSERAVVRVEVKRVLPRPARRTAALSRSLGAGRRGIVLPAAATGKRGRYTIVLVARDAAGNVSKPKTLRLTTR